MPKTSIIVPIYNAQNTLSYCLDSILNQTYNNYEIILVNDGSTDKSEALIKKYLQKYPDKIKYFSQKNGGVASARNNGINKSKGKYLFFVDNDDFLDSDYIERFVEEIERTKADVVFGGYKRTKKDGTILFRRDVKIHPTSKYVFLPPWARIYRKESLIKNNLKFLNINIADDLYLNVLANLKLNVLPTEYNGYNWVDNKSSVSNTDHKGFNKKLDFIPLLEKIHVDTKGFKLKQEEKELLEYFFIKTCLFYILYSGKGVEYANLKTEAQEILSWLKRNYPDYRRNKLISPLTPEGEILSTRTIIWIYILLQKLHLENAFLWVYSKL